MNLYFSIDRIRPNGAALAVLSAVSVLLASPPLIHAHVVPKDTFDRTISIHIQSGTNGAATLVVDYRLEVDELTLALEELDRLRKLDISVNPLDYRGEPLKYYAEFLRHYAPLLGRNLSVHLNEVPLELKCTNAIPNLRDENGELLGHLRCDFTFCAELSANLGERCTLSFREGNYEERRGKIHVVFAGVPVPQFAATVCGHFPAPAGPYNTLNLFTLTALSPGIRVLSVDQPGAAQRNLAEIDRTPGVEEQLRQIRVSFELQAAASAPEVRVQTAPLDRRQQTDDAASHSHGLLQLVLHSDYGIGLLLLIFAGVGAVHALTPGHGKTLVAAYLVGQRGTILHAFILGLVTTLTHTGAVLVFAVALNFVPERSLFRVQAGLGLAMGLAIACLGFWLFLKRVSAGADHIHLGGGHHHHGHTHEHPPASDVTWWNLIVLGMTGGIIPCWDAVAILGLCVGRGQLWLALPLVIAFSAGLAGVLVVIGILVVRVRGFASSRWGEGRLSQILPILSAIVIMAMGIWLCYESTRGRDDSAADRGTLPRAGSTSSGSRAKQTMKSSVTMEFTARQTLLRGSGRPAPVPRRGLPRLPTCPANAPVLPPSAGRPQSRQE